MQSSKFHLVLHLAAIFVVTAKSENIFEKFLAEKLASYDRWISANNFDPSQVIVGPTHIQGYYGFSVVDCYLSNHVVRDHSSNINVTSVKADLETITVSLTLQEPVTFSGKYVGNGSSWSGSFSGEGNWNITFPEIKFRNLLFNYAVSEDGYVYITDHNLNGVPVPGSLQREAEVFFENFVTDDDITNDSILNAVYDAFCEYLKEDSEHPLKKIYLKFFEEIFENTTWADIIIPNMKQTPCATTVQVKETTSSTTTPSRNSDTNNAGQFAVSKWVLFLSAIGMMFRF